MKRIFPVLLVLALSCPSMSAQNRKMGTANATKLPVKAFNLIVPGVKIGPIKIGDSEAQVLKSIGPEDEKIRHSRDITVATHHNVNENPEKPNFAFDNVEDRIRVFYAKNRVIQIDVSAVNYRTQDGIGPETILDKALRKYSALNRTTYGYGENGENYTHIFDDAKRGVAFIVDPSYRYGRTQKITWTSVHRPGKTALPHKNVKATEAAEPVADDMFVELNRDKNPVVQLEPGNGLPLVKMSEGNATSPIFRGHIGSFFYVKTHHGTARLKVPVVRLTLIRYSNKTAWRRLKSATFSSDGEAGSDFKGSWSSGVVSPGILRESFLIELPYEQFVKLAKADQFDFGIDDSLYIFRDDQMAGIRALAKAVKPK